MSVVLGPRYDEAPGAGRPRTIQERFGFVDADLKTPQHDSLMLWLDEEMGEPRGKRAFVVAEHVAAKAIDAIREHEGASARITHESCVWEQPIMSRSFTVGFVDMVVTLKVGWCRIHVYLEVKSTISSLGELVRQVRMYEQYVTKGETYCFGVVSPDTRFAEAIERQGIAFIPVWIEKP